MLEAALAPYALLIAFGFLPSVVWKFLGAFVAHGIDENSRLLAFVRAMATTLLAGVACKLLFAPAGALALVPMPARFAALAIGMLAFALGGRSVLAAVVVGEAALMGLAWTFGG